MELRGRDISETTIIGLVILVQGLGSGIAKAGWDTNWGLLAVVERWIAMPAWIGFVLGAVGLVVALVGLRSSDLRSAEK